MRRTDTLDSFLRKCDKFGWRVLKKDTMYKSKSLNKIIVLFYKPETCKYFITWFNEGKMNEEYTYSFRDFLQARDSYRISLFQFIKYFEEYYGNKNLSA